MSIKYTFKAPQSGYSLANPPKDSWFKQTGAFREYLGTISKCGKYLVRISEEGVFVSNIEEHVNYGHIPVHPASVTISST